MDSRVVTNNTAGVRSYCRGIGATGVIYPAALFSSFALGVVSLGIVFFARDVFGATPVQIGWLAGIWSMAYTLSCMLLRPVFSHFVPRSMILTSAGLMCLFTLGIQFASSLTVVSICLALSGVAMSMFWPPLMAWLSDGHEGKSLGRRFSNYNIMWSIGTVASPYICGWLAERSARYPIFLGSVVFGITAVYILGTVLVLPNSGNGISQTEGIVSGIEPSEHETPIRFPAWIGLFASFFGLGALLSIFPLAAKEELHIAESTVGLLFLVRALLGAIGFYIIGRSVFWHFRMVPMLGVQFLMVICFGLLSMFGVSPKVIGGLFGMLAMLIAFSYSYSVFHGVSGCTDRVKRMAIHESVLSIGFISGSAAGGMLYEVSSMAHVYVMCALVLLVGIAAQYLVYQIVRRRTAW